MSSSLSSGGPSLTTEELGGMELDTPTTTNTTTTTTGGTTRNELDSN